MSASAGSTAAPPKHNNLLLLQKMKPKSGHLKPSSLGKGQAAPKKKVYVEGLALNNSNKLSLDRFIKAKHTVYRPDGNAYCDSIHGFFP